jgi:hypothetical protein
MSTTLTGADLFAKVLSMTGLSEVLGPGILRRALADEGVTPEHAEPEHYQRALPRLEARMRAYMAPEVAQRHARRIAGFLALAAGEGGRHPSPARGFGRSVDILRAAREGPTASPDDSADTRADVSWDDVSSRTGVGKRPELPTWDDATGRSSPGAQRPIQGTSDEMAGKSGPRKKT